MGWMYRTIFLVVLIVINCQCQNKEVNSSEPKIEAIESMPDWITKDYVMGKFNPEQHVDFVKIPRKFTDRDGLFLRKDALDDFERMWAAASADGVVLLIRSATRNFDYQKGIWERKWNGETRLSDDSSASDIENKVERAKKILLYSSMPGTSRHHWGTDIDLNSFNNDYFSKGDGKKIYDWLLTHAGKYGYCQPYTHKSNGRTGYEEEKWHWTYSPVSKILTNFWKESVSNTDLTGFEGSDTADSVDMLGNYVLGIDSKCL